MDEIEVDLSEIFRRFPVHLVTMAANFARYAEADEHTTGLALDLWTNKEYNDMHDDGEFWPPLLDSRLRRYIFCSCGSVNLSAQMAASMVRDAKSDGYKSFYDEYPCSQHIEAIVYVKAQDWLKYIGKRNLYYETFY